MHRKDLVLLLPSRSFNLLIMEYLLSILFGANLILFLQSTPDGNRANGPTLLVSDRNKYKSMLIRTYSTLWMIGGFAFVIYMGHLYIWAMIVVIQIFMATELFNLLRKSSEEKQLPGFRLLNW